MNYNDLEKNNIESTTLNIDHNGENEEQPLPPGYDEAVGLNAPKPRVFPPGYVSQEGNFIDSRPDRCKCNMLIFFAVLSGLLLVIGAWRIVIKAMDIVNKENEPFIIVRPKNITEEYSDDYYYG